MKRKLKGEILQSATERAEYCGGYFKGQHIYGILNNVWRTAWERCEMAMMPTVRAAIQIGELKERERIRFNSAYDERRNAYIVSADMLNTTRSGIEKEVVK